LYESFMSEFAHEIQAFETATLIEAYWTLIYENSGWRGPRSR
jgi:hypothetical protein